MDDIYLPRAVIWVGLVLQCLGPWMKCELQEHMVDLVGSGIFSSSFYGDWYGLGANSVP